MTQLLQHSFIEVPPESHFPIQNLPYGIFSPTANASPRVGVAIGDKVLDLATLAKAGLLPVDAQVYFAQPTLNAFMAAGKAVWQETRATLQHVLGSDTSTLRDNADLLGRVLYAQKDVTLQLPVAIGDYTDFYSSKEHATNLGTMFRGKENALMPNWLHIPIGYHGRASSIVVSGTAIHRPQGQTMPQGATTPVFGPSKLLDFELETGFFIGPGNALGQPISVKDAPDHMFGLVLVNDWSARDIQAWEYQPLGPFLAKNFATSISPWVVTMDALAPFRVTAPVQEPTPLPYLQSDCEEAYDVHLEVTLQTPTLASAFTISRSNLKYMYWTVCQQLAHHTITGCNLRPGDLLASGTLSGTTPDSYGSLIELTWRGTQPLALPNGESRRFLEDGDTLTITGYCQGEGYRVGFGSVTGTILPAVSL